MQASRTISNSGSVMRWLRILTGHSLDEIAMRCNAGAPYLSRIERGRLRPGSDLRKALADYFGVPIDALLMQTEVDLYRPQLETSPVTRRFASIRISGAPAP